MSDQQLQRTAMAPFDCINVDGLDDHAVEENGALDGDTLALFIWREVGDAADPTEAIRMLHQAQRDLDRSIESIAGEYSISPNE